MVLFTDNGLCAMLSSLNVAPTSDKRWEKGCAPFAAGLRPISPFVLAIVWRSLEGIDVV
jgi:hypothetical protein